MSASFPEDTLTLLGKPVNEETPLSYYERIRSYYAERKSRTKARPTLLKGKFITKPTKKISGTYALMFGELMCEFVFDKTRELSAQVITQITETLKCEPKTLRTFLKKKKFLLDDCEAHE